MPTHPHIERRRCRPHGMLLLLALSLLAAQLFCGDAPVQLSDWRHDIILAMRFWRGVGAFLIGSSLALSGLLCQILFRNPLATPSTLGISSGAAAGAAATFLFCSGMLLHIMVPVGAFVGALAALALVLLVSRGGSRGTDTLLLSGVIVSTVISSLLVYLISISDSRELAGVTWWTLGDLQSIAPFGQLLLGFLALCVLVILRWHVNSLNALSLGDEDAAALGVPVRQMRLLLVISASLLASASVALAGIISFVGLIIPHLVRRLWGCNQRHALTLTFLFGGVFLQFCDLLSKLSGNVRQTPIGVITACIGGMLFLLLLHRRRFQP